MNITNIKIKDSVVALTTESAILDELDNFDLASASPVDCHVFVRKLKERYARR